MNTLTRYRSADLPQLMDRISKNSIGLDNFFESFFDSDVTTNYPPYNLIHVNNVESRLEIALAGFKKKEVKVYTEYGIDHSREHGQSQKIVKLEMLLLKMVYLQLN